MKKINEQFNQRLENMANSCYVCTCQFFFDNINEVEQLIINKNNDSDEVIDKKALKFNVVAIYNLLRQANIAKDCLILWQWKLNDKQIVSCTIIGYDSNNKINILAISLRSWLVTDQLEEVIEEEKDGSDFIHPYIKASYVHQTIENYLNVINNADNIVLRTCVYLPFYDFSLNNPENLKTIAGQTIFTSQIINLVCNYNFNINVNFFYANNKIFLISQIKTMFFKGNGQKAFHQLFDSQKVDETNLKVEQEINVFGNQDHIIERNTSHINNKPKQFVVSSYLKSQDDDSKFINMILPRHSFAGFYDQTVKSLSKRFAKIKYIKTGQIILVDLTNFKPYRVHRNGEIMSVNNIDNFDFFEVKFNIEQEIVIMQQLNDNKLVQYKKINPSNLKLHLVNEINEAKLIKNNKSLANTNILQR